MLLKPTESIESALELRQVCLEKEIAMITLLQRLFLRRFTVTFLYPNPAFISKEFSGLR